MIALITGATSGIGRATAAKFAQEGYDLVLTGRRTDRLADLKASLTAKYPVRLHTTSFDVRQHDACVEAIETLPPELRNIDILVNNAGLALGMDEMHEADVEDWNIMIDTNVKGLLFMSRTVSRIMVERESGHIINVCSTAGHEVYPKGHVYCATKHGVDALTKGFRLDLHKYGIRVSQVSPAHVEDTEFAKVRFHGDEQRANIYSDFQPLKATDVADAIFYIASRPAHVNIQDIVMMGTQQANSTTIDRSGRKYD